METIDPRIRTTEVFRAAEVNAEGTVALVRVVVALALGAALLLALGGESARPDNPLLQRQWLYAVLTVAAYFALGAFGWLLVRTGRFRGWMTWPMTAGDCAFVLISLWLGLQNTGLAGEYAFVFPAIWLVPMVLAFGALRFDPWVQIFVGVLILGGIWVIERRAGLPGGPVDYETLDLFLGGPPTVMRLAMLAMAGAILALSAFRARWLLLRALTERDRSHNLGRYLPAELAPRLAAGGLEELRAGRREEMAILFIDLRGFTALCETLSPREVSDFISDYRGRITKAARAHGGMIDKFMGDAALVTFENAIDPGAAARACLDCAARLSGDIADWSASRVATGQPPVHAGIGLHWGAVFCGVVGDETRLEYSIFGDPVNIAARLEELTKIEDAGQIASRRLLDRAGISAEAAGWSPIANRNLRGRSGEIEILGRS